MEEPHGKGAGAGAWPGDGQAPLPAARSLGRAPIICARAGSGPARRRPTAGADKALHNGRVGHKALNGWRWLLLVLIACCGPAAFEATAAIVLASAVESGSAAPATPTAGPITAAAGSPTANASIADNQKQPQQPPNDVNKHPALRGPAVLCNSRCRCFLLELAGSQAPAGAANESARATWPPNTFGPDTDHQDEDDQEAAAAAGSEAVREPGAAPEVEPVPEEEQLPRSLLPVGGGGGGLVEQQEPRKPPQAELRQMLRLGPSSGGVGAGLEKAPHQVGPAVQLYAQAFHPKQAQVSSLGGAGAGGSKYSLAAAQAEAVGLGKRLKAHSLAPFRLSGASRWPQLPAGATLRELAQVEARGLFANHSSGWLAAGQTSSKQPTAPSQGLLNATRHLLLQVSAHSTSTDEPRALNLARNKLNFELWCELYALLAPHFRRRIYALDLSHNSLPKLGLTFTGFIEHQLVALNGTWPGNQNQPQSATRTSGSGASLPNPKNLAANRPKQLLSSGQLYELARNLSHWGTAGGDGSQQEAAASSHPLQDNQQQVVQETARSVKGHLLTQPIQIRALDLSHNRLKWLINDQFRALKHVQSIRLDHNRIRYIHRHAFSGLEWLRYLSLSWNKLQVIYTEQFQTNYNLLALRLRNNYLAYLRGGSFTSLSSLRRLDVSQNKLTLVSGNAFVGLDSLEHLNCSSNQFLQVPSTSLQPLLALRQLDLSNNLLGQLMPGAFFHLPLGELWLGNNSQLSDIERGAFWDLPYLRELHLSGCPSLTSVNSQAFVATPSLAVIGAEGCPVLDADSRQLLENTTRATVTRMLRLQMRLNAAPENASHLSAETPSPLASISLLNASSTIPLPPAPPPEATRTDGKQVAGKSTLGLASLMEPAAHLLAAGSAPALSQKYLYFVGSLALLAALVKLLFKYTGPSRYLAAVRRRRRVYEAQAGAAPELELAHFRPLWIRPPVIEAPGAHEQQAAWAQEQQQQQQVVDISVISGDCSLSDGYLGPQEATAGACSQCPLPGCAAPPPVGEAATCSPATCPAAGAQSSREADLIHTQLVAAGYECGHANCAHFYQAALHLAADYC